MYVNVDIFNIMLTFVKNPACPAFHTRAHVHPHVWYPHVVGSLDVGVSTWLRRADDL
jgi:hypothetical protein